MKRNHILLLAAGLTLSLGGLGYLAYKALPYQAPAVANGEAGTVSAEAPIEIRLSPEDQGYVECPETDDAIESPNPDTASAPQHPSCLADLLPWAAAPAPFRVDSSLESLRTQCGAVFADFLFYHGAGQCQWGTVMFPGTGRELQIVWHNWREKRSPRLLRFIGPDLHFATGLRPGLALKDVMQLNGKPITLTGFGWEGSGYHRSFQGGTLQGFDALDAPYRIHYTMDWDLLDAATEAEHASVIIGDSPLESTEPALEKFKAQVEYIDFRFGMDDTTPQWPL
ncbi:hypothetical protein [Oligoflexus tunisiensis]|uniref:hypothetical protein n=1 Tax=Oligoflexus tunisiensis TaxID=708132 RepID=UPI00114CA2CF|nr:hypothetical protein [Oligoflexus tunisiensis]